MNIEEIKEYKKQFTEEQLDEMAKLYDEGEKTKNIIQKYNLTIKEKISKIAQNYPANVRTSSNEALFLIK